VGPLLGCDHAELVPQDILINASPEQLDFPPVIITDTWEHHVRLTSVGSGTLNILGVRTETAGFASELPAVTVLKSGESTQLNVRFSPLDTGGFDATLVVLSNAANTPELRITLRGSGLPIPSCEDGNQCTHGSYDIALHTCVQTNHELPCDDGSTCTLDDRCMAGQCRGVALSCDDGNPCTRDVCDAALSRWPIASFLVRQQPRG